MSRSGDEYVCEIPNEFIRQLIRLQSKIGTGKKMTWEDEKLLLRFAALTLSLKHGSSKLRYVSDSPIPAYIWEAEL